jgi:hypothetical protein
MENIAHVEESTISIFVPMVIKRRGGGHATMILPKNAPQEAREASKPNYDHRLINAFAKAYKWQHSIIKNPKLTTYAIAEKENVTPSYVSKLLRLNLVAPDIIKAIVDGKQPRDLMLQDLMKRTLPDLWQEQREMFGF